MTSQAAVDREPLESAFRDMAMALAERSPTEEEFADLWGKLGEVVRYLVTHDPDPQDPEDDDDMCPNCVTPWKCNGPHVSGPLR